MTNSATEASPRDRLLGVADELFNRLGIHAVGVDLVIAQARVAKSTFYSHFRSKDQLVAAYLQERFRSVRNDLEHAAGSQPDGDERQLLATLDKVAEWCRSEDFRGCNFINAAAEYAHDGPAMDVIRQYRRWLRDFYADLAARCGFAETGRLAAILVQHYDGVMTVAHLDREPTSASSARESLRIVLGSWPRR